MDVEISGMGQFQKSAGRLRQGPSEADKIGLAQAVEDGFVTSGNYVNVIRKGQGQWKPLTKAYVARKRKKGLSSMIWVLRGDTFDALTDRIKITGRMNKNSYGRTLVVKKPGKRFRVSMEVRMGAPAATGWPDRRSKKSWFYKNNRIRPILGEVTTATETKVLDNMMDTVLAWIIRATS